MVRKGVLFLVVMSVASMAFAFTMPTQGHQGHVKMKFTDFTHYYDPQTGEPVTPSMNPADWAQPYDQGGLIGLEVRSIFNCYSIGYVDSGAVFHETWSPADTDEQITGVYHNVVVSNVQLVAVGPVSLAILDHSPIAPPPAPVDNDAGPGPYSPAGPVDLPPWVTPPKADDGGARVSLYLDDIGGGGTPYTNDPDGGDPTNGPAQWAGVDVENRMLYPTVTDGQLFSDLVMMDLSNYRALGVPQGCIKQVTINLNTRTGTSEFDLNFINGPANIVQALFTTLNNYPALPGPQFIVPDWAGQQPQWTDFPGALYGDAHGLSNVEFGGFYNGWFFKSEDPVDFALVVIPEPATCLLLGGGLLTLVRRRKRS